MNDKYVKNYELFNMSLGLGLGESVVRLLDLHISHLTNRWLGLGLDQKT